MIDWLVAHFQVEDLLWNDYLDSVQNTVMEPMNSYIISFPSLRVRPEGQSHIFCCQTSPGILAKGYWWLSAASFMTTSRYFACSCYFIM